MMHVVRIKESNAATSGKVLGDEVVQQGTLAGAGLADDVEMAAALLGVEHDEIARDAGAEAKLLW